MYFSTFWQISTATYFSIAQQEGDIRLEWTYEPIHHIFSPILLNAMKGNSLSTVISFSQRGDWENIYSMGAWAQVV
jgi:hypothetical protein